jgi:MoxR-like ATPase
MLALRFGLLVFLLSGLAVCQEGTASEAAENAVQTVMSRASDGVYTSWDEKQLDKLGDAAAVALTKVIGNNDLNPDEIRQVLLIITLSFNAPRMIAIEADRSPRTAFFVLKCLDHLAVDPDLRNRISETRALLEHVNKPKS